LKEEIEECARELKFPLKKIYVVDASKRSDHSNAYYFGFGSNKRIVLFDTLLKQHENQKEIVAIVYHELGHWYYSHPLKMIMASIVNLCLLFYTFSLVLNNMALLKSFGITEPSNFFSFFIFLKIYGLLGYLLSRAINALSRRFEY
jgi:STE24 endopeptidase